VVVVLIGKLSLKRSRDALNSRYFRPMSMFGDIA
jgi:hypothetical protein